MVRWVLLFVFDFASVNFFLLVFGFLKVYMRTSLLIYHKRIIKERFTKGQSGSITSVAKTSFSS